jgi:hypothetical protein
MSQFEETNVITKEATKILKYKIPYNRNTTQEECRSKSETSNDRGNWDHHKRFRKYLSHIPVKYEIKELETTAIPGTGHWALGTDFGKCYCKRFRKCLSHI